MRAIVFVTALMLLSDTGIGQWVQVGKGSPVTSFAAVGSTLFAGTAEAGIYASTDNGHIWVPTVSSPADPIVRWLASMDTALFAVTENLGVFLSTDKGQHWKAVNNGLPKGAFAIDNSLAILGTKILVYGREGSYPYTYAGLYYSTDRGENWVRAGSNLSANVYGTRCLGTIGTMLFAGTVNAGFYLSRDSGESWISSNNGMTDQYGNLPIIECCATKAGYLYVGTDRGVFRSSDGGQTWIATSNGFPEFDNYAHWISSLVPCGADLLAGTRAGGVFRSTDNGTTWSQTNAGLMGKDVASLYSDGTDIIAGTGCGVFHALDGAWTWSSALGLGPFVSGTIFSLLARGPELFVGVDRGVGRGPHEANILHSTDNGDSWHAVADFCPSALIVAGTDLYGLSGYGVVRSTDDGQTWVARNAGLPVWPDDSPYVAANSIVFDGQQLFAGTVYGVYRSNDNAATWNARNEGIRDQSISRMLAVGTSLCAGTDTNGVFRSTDAGATWLHIRSGLPRNSYGYPAWISGLVSMGDDVFASTSVGVYQLSGGGQEWTVTKSPSSIEGLATSGQTLIAWGGGMNVKINPDSSWTAVDNNGLPDQSFVLQLWADDRYVYACPGYGNASFDWGAGLWRRPLSEIVTSIGEPQRREADGFRMSQNYPNPFNPSTSIRYELPKASMVRIGVYDILGREVSVLVNERKNAGSYEVKFDGSNLASGVYFYRMQAADFIQTKRLLLLK